MELKMAQLTRFNQLPLGVIRAAYGPKIVLIIDSQLPIVHDELLKLKPIAPLQTTKRYWVISANNQVFDIIGNKTTTQTGKLGGAKLIGFTVYDDALDQFERFARLDAGKSAINRQIGAIGQLD